MSDTLDDLKERSEYCDNELLDIRHEAEIDMQYVSGDPWSPEDKKARENRVTVAPEEMSQYFNQVINALKANPRGMKFAPTGNGANDKGARFYQNKAREIEYRSHASVAYVTAAQNAIERSYGFVRINTRHASPKSENQEIWIDAMPDPDMVRPDPDALRPDSSDQMYAFVDTWMEIKEFNRRHKKHKLKETGTLGAGGLKDWIKGSKVRLAEYWAIETKPRQLLLVQPPPPTAQKLRTMQDPKQVATLLQPMQMFEDELTAKLMTKGAKVLRKLRKVDYPEVKMYLTNGVEILHEQKWAGKYIPIVSCYGKILYVPKGGETKRMLMSMTRFGRHPWKSYCYACSQQLELIAQVPKASMMAIAGQLAGFEKDWAEAPHVPKAWLYYNPTTAATGEQHLEAPQKIDGVDGVLLQALELVKEGFRRAIQSAMGSNFLPTQAQKRNEKSGIALDKIEQAATQGSYHFVQSYEDMIRMVGVITEDLIDKIHDYKGETGTMEADGKAETVVINSPKDPDAISTKGDYLVTVSSAPSSDSEREAAKDFTEALVQHIEPIAQIAGPKPAAAIMAQSIRMLNLGVGGDKLADLIEPPEYKTKDGEPPSPEIMSMKAEMQKLQQMLQQAAQEREAKVAETQAKGQIEMQKANLDADKELALQVMKNAAAIAVAHIGAAAKGADINAHAQEEAQALAHQEREGVKDRMHESIEAVKDRLHERHVAERTHAQALEAGHEGHQQALEQADQGIEGQLAVGQQAADLAPEPAAGE